MFKKLFFIILALVLILITTACQNFELNLPSSTTTANSSNISTSNISTPSAIPSRHTSSYNKSTHNKRFYENNGVLKTNFVTPAEIMDILEKTSGVKLCTAYMINFSNIFKNHSLTLEKNYAEITIELSFLKADFNKQVENIKAAGFLETTKKEVISSNYTSSGEENFIYFKKDVTVNNKNYTSYIVVEKKTRNDFYNIEDIINLETFNIHFNIYSKNPYKVYLLESIKLPQQYKFLPVSRDLLDFNENKIFINAFTYLEMVEFIEDFTKVKFSNTLYGQKNSQIFANDNYINFSCNVYYETAYKEQLLKNLEAVGFTKIKDTQNGKKYAIIDKTNEKYIFFHLTNYSNIKYEIAYIYAFSKNFTDIRTYGKGDLKTIKITDTLAEYKR